MSMINVSNLTFAYDGSYENVFENVSFQIDTDWRLGFTGRNGRGKTTFLKLLSGAYEYSGSISSSVDFLYFPFDVKDKSKITIDIARDINIDSARNIYHEFERWELERELSMLDVDIDVLDRPYNTLSNGEQTKLNLAVLFLHDNGYLLIDEPTNHLDAAARKVVSDYLKTKKGFILVSHDRTVLDNCVDHVLSINKTNIEIQRGNFSSWLTNKERQDSFEIATNEKLKKDISRLKTAAARTSEWSDNVEKTKYATKNSGLRPDRGFIGHKSAKMMKRAKSLENRQQSLIEEKSQLLKNIEDADSLKIHPQKYHSSRLVTFDNVSIFYGDKLIADKISFEINHGDRIALCGKNGSGKSSVIKLIRNISENFYDNDDGNFRDDSNDGHHNNPRDNHHNTNLVYTGNKHVGKSLIISHVSQDTAHICGSLTAFAKNHNIDESLFKAILRKLDFSRAQFEKDISDFSGGQKKKVLVAKSLCEKAHLYIWDEPLNFIDVLSRMQIEELLLRYEPTMLFVEHDKAFTDIIATKTVFM